MDYLPCVEVNPSQSADALVLWLHGLGADGHDFEFIVPELRLPAELAIRFLFPHAPSIPVTINNGSLMPAWFDIVSDSIEQQIDTKRLLHSATQIADLIDRESRHIDSSRIIIAGFSQGGAVGYQVALTYAKPLAGLMAMSTYFASDSLIDEHIHHANKSLPINIHHGTLDPIVPESLGQESYKIMRARGYNVSYQTYPMQHQVCATQIADISAWLQKVLR